MPNNGYTMFYNSTKNRIYITFNKTLDEESTREYIKDFKALADKSKPGFTVNIDVLNAGVHSTKVDEIFAEARSYAIEKGIKATGTVIGTSVIYKLQLKMTLSEIGNELFATAEDADRYLDSL